MQQKLRITLPLCYNSDFLRRPQNLTKSFNFNLIAKCGLISESVSIWLKVDAKKIAALSAVCL